MRSFYTEKELQELGLKSYGRDVLISRKASIYGADRISIGSNVRIDDFCILSGEITIGSNIHISAFCGLYGSHGIILEDFTGLSPRSTIFSATDDFSGDYLIGSIHSDHYTNVTGGVVRLHRYSHLGASSVVFPSVDIAQGCLVGAMSLVKESLKPWGIYAGIPAKRIGERSQTSLLERIKNV